MKQQFKGTVNLDVANRTVTLVGIELSAERVLLVVNATVGFVYHNFSIDDPAVISIVGGNTVIQFADYKDCDVHQNTDKVAVFYEDGVDLGKLIKDEFDETQTLISTEFGTTRTQLTGFQTEVKAEFDQTQTLISTEFGTTRTQLTAFQTEVKAEFDGTQTILNDKLPALINGRIPVLNLDAFSPANGYTVSFTNGIYGPTQAVFTRSGVIGLRLNFAYDANGEITSVTPV